MAPEGAGGLGCYESDMAVYLLQFRTLESSVAFKNCGKGGRDSEVGPVLVVRPDKGVVGSRDVFCFGSRFQSDVFSAGVCGWGRVYAADHLAVGEFSLSAMHSGMGVKAVLQLFKGVISDSGRSPR